MNISTNNLSILLLLPWAFLWLAGGLWLARAAFRLRLDEEIFVGIALGWIGQNWLANLLAQGMPAPLAFWLAAAIIFAGGGLAVVLRLGWNALFRWPVRHVPVLLMVAFAGIVLITYEIGRGLAIFDDFSHLNTISVMATGDIPPHFVLDPAVVYGYHHFLELFSAQLLRIGFLMPWLAFDASRAFSFGLAVMLSGLFALRVTRSPVGGVLGGAAIAFGSGTRWLLLMLPAGLVAWMGKGIQMIGSGAGSGASLPEALVNTWAVEGAGPVGFPFAFANGIYPAGVVQMLNANGLAGFVVIFTLLLTFNRWRNGLGGVLSAVLLSVWGLLGEAELPAFALGWVVVAAACLFVNRGKAGSGDAAAAESGAPRPHFLPGSLWTWLGVMVAGGLIGLLEGGAWTDILVKQIERLTGSAVVNSYQTIGFQFAWPPAVVSSHLGVLSLLNPRTLTVALFELGPLLLVFPLIVIWGVKAFRAGRWFEAALVATAVIMALAVFVQFNGSTGVRNTPRLYTFMPVLAALAVPLVWLWASHRSSVTRALVIGLGLVTLTGGLVMFGIELVAIQRPVYSYFLTPLDARMTRAYWNRLEFGALVFDSEPYRAPTVLGRPTNSNLTWYKSKPEWDSLRAAPDPAHLRAAGFQYMYLDNRYWDSLPASIQQALSSGCVQVTGEESDNQGNFRRLLDLSGCETSP